MKFTVKNRVFRKMVLAVGKKFPGTPRQDAVITLTVFPGMVVGATSCRGGAVLASATEDGQCDLPRDQFEEVLATFKDDRVLSVCVNQNGLKIKGFTMPVLNFFLKPKPVRKYEWFGKLPSDSKVSPGKIITSKNFWGANAPNLNTGANEHGGKDENPPEYVSNRQTAQEVAENPPKFFKSEADAQPLLCKQEDSLPIAENEPPISPETITSSNKNTEPTWIVESSKYYYDPESKSNALRELFDNEDKAMKFAAEKSLKCHSDSTVINVTVYVDGRASLIAQYEKGEEQFEKQALESIIKDCRMFAVCAGKSGPSPFTFIFFFVVVFLAWAYGMFALSNLFDNYLAGTLAASAAIWLACAYYYRRVNTQAKYYAAEAEKWARQIAYRVSTTDQVLLGRIFSTRRENPVKMPPFTIQEDSER